MRCRETLKSKIMFNCRKYRMLFYLYKNKIFNVRDLKVKEKYDARIKSIKRYNTSNVYLYENEEIPRVAVYTCIFGNYDSVKPIHNKNKNCDYWIITDQQVSPESGWKKFEINLPEEVKNASPTIKNRYCKMHPHILFPSYDYSIYMDGSICIYADVFPLLGKMEDKIIGMYQHGSRDCIYEEAKKVVEYGKAPEDIVKKQIHFYKQEGFPEHFGLTDCIVIVRKHNEKQCIKIMEDWWKLFWMYSKRDQLSFMYVLWKNDMTFKDIAKLGMSYGDEARLLSTGHKN